MNKLISIVIFFLISAICNGQVNTKAEVAKDSICNRDVYGTKKYIKELPDYICIPIGFVIDDYIRMADKDQNGVNDFIAIKYNKKEDDQVDGDTTYWAFYDLDSKDSLFKLSYTLSNLVPPFLKNISLSYLANTPLAEQIFNNYPRRVNHKSSFIIKNDIIKLSYKLDDVFGKTFVFRYGNSNWFLESVEYFIGELPSLWWQNNEFYYPLKNEFLLIEKVKPKVYITIDLFDLREAFRYRDIEISHLAEWHIDNLDESKSKTIKDADIAECNGITLPSNWKY